MMKSNVSTLLLLILSVSLMTGCFGESKESDPVKDTAMENEVVDNDAMDKDLDMDANDNSVMIDPISHATSVITWGDKVIFVDPTGGAEAFEGQAFPDIILVTDIHGDHLNIETLQALVHGEGSLIVPQAVADQLPDGITSGMIVMENGATIENAGFSIEAIPMYNLPESEDSRHIKGRGNGYILEKDGQRLYIAGDTADIPEMRALRNIDIALIPMNLPYTMSVESAADAVVEFAPKKVYPYHYRGQDGLSDVDRFKEIVEGQNPNIEVVLLEWYPAE